MQRRGTAPRHIVRVGVDVTEARQAESAIHQTEILRQSQEQLRTLTAGLVEAQEEERRRVSQELHDDISQRLAALSIQAAVLHQAHGISPDELRCKLGELQKQMEALSEDLRRTARNLHPFTLTHLGLGEALRSYCAEFSNLRQFKVRFTARTLPGTIPPGVALCVYRVVQEALGNVSKHSGAARAEVSISGNNNALRVAIRDDGHGFDLDDAKGKGLGLISMEERVRHLGGTFSISPTPGDGTRIEIRIPLEISLRSSPRNRARHEQAAAVDCRRPYHSPGRTEGSCWRRNSRWWQRLAMAGRCWRPRKNTAPT